MATASNRSKATAETAPETGTETQTTALELDVATAPPAPAVTAAETEPDPRESALAQLVYGHAPQEVVTADSEPEVDPSTVIDFGGRSKGVVLFSRYNQMVDGEFKQARKGDVIATTADKLADGVKIGALRKLAAEDSE
jgi:hypothetical protein